MTRKDILVGVLALGSGLLLASCGGGGGPRNQAPIAQFSATPDRGAFPLPVTFDGSASSDDSGIASYAWSFSDGTAASGARVEKTFGTRGSFTATLTVTDAAGLTGSTTRTVEVLNNEPPEIALSLDVTEGIVPLTVNLDASATRDPENRSMTFAWSLGDGNAAQGSKVTHIFDSADSFTVTLTVKDDVNQAQTTREVKVNLPQSVSVKGSIRLAETNLIDADTNDPSQTSNADNNTCASSQRLSVPVSVGGFVTQAATSQPGDRFESRPDRFDAYRASLAKGTSVELFVDEFEAGASDNPTLGVGILSGDCREYLVANVDPTGYKKITVPADGEYYIVIAALEGAAGYVVRLTSPLEGATAARMNAATGWSSQIPEHVPDEVILSFRDAGRAAAAMSAIRAKPYASAVDSMQVVGARVMRINVKQVGMNKSLFTGAVARDRRGRAVNADNRSVVEAFGVRYRSKALQDYVELSQIAAQLQKDLQADAAELNLILRPNVVPSDPLYATQKWHYDMINLPQAWDRYLTTNRSQAVVAVIDSGAYLAHPDLQPNLVPGYDFLESDTLDGDGPDANPDDPGYIDQVTGRSASSHGTHVAGTVAAVTNNGVGVAGVGGLGGNVKVMPLRVCGVQCPGIAVYNAILYAAGQTVNGARRTTRVDVINLSLGGASSCPQFLQTALDTARAAGIVIVAAAGNEFERGNPTSWPANCAGVVAVGALGPSERRSSYSQVQDYVDIAAPGGDARLQNIYPYSLVASTDINGVQNNRSPAYRALQGTSMATPHVAGAVAMMRAIWPGLTPQEFDGLLSAGQLTRPANERTDTSRSAEYGFGVLDLSKGISVAVTGAATGSINYLIPQPSSIDFGSSVTQRLLEITKRGSASITRVEPVVAVRWLSVERVSDDATRAQYRLSVNRSGLIGGSYGVVLRITAGDGTRLDVPVTVRVASAAADIFSVPVYVLVYDQVARKTVESRTVKISDTAAIDFEIPRVPPSKTRYILVAGSDTDNDFFICEVGDLCNAWPLLPQLIGISGDRNTSGASLTLAFENRVVDGSPATLNISTTATRSLR